MLLSAIPTRRAFLCDLARFGGSVVGLGLLASCAPAPPPAAPARVYRVGLLSGAPAQQTVLWERLGELGYVEGQNLVREERFTAGDTARYDELAAELARLPLDVIVAAGGGALAPSWPPLRRSPSS